MNRPEYSRAYRSLALVPRTPPAGGLLARLTVGTVVAVAALAFVPWQQTVNAYGRVTVFSPAQRPQEVQTPIDGRVARWLVREGDRVKQGQLIAELADNKPEYLDPALARRYREQRAAYVDKQEALTANIAALGAQTRNAEVARRAVLASTSLQITQAQSRLDSAKQAAVSAAQVELTARINLERRRRLFDAGVRSRRDYELGFADAAKARADAKAANAQLEVASAAVTIALADRLRQDADTAAKIAELSAKLAESRDKLATIGNDRAKLEVDISNFDQRLLQRRVVAPFSGQIARVVQYSTGQALKAGDPLATLVPEKQDQAVELFVSDNDAPLIAPGRPVRLQFAGWPAVQFMGWPSVAVGTFAGRVSVIDAAVDGSQKYYRLLVVPDRQAAAAGREQPWPDSRLLRPGGNVRGWILLNRVALGYELWRQFNGFPPTAARDLQKPEGDKGEKGAKTDATPEEPPYSKPLYMERKPKK